MDDMEKYLLSTSRKVVPLLKALTRKPDLITVKIPNSEQSVLTAVLDVLTERNLLILDYGPSDSLNNKLLAAERIICTTLHDMVETRFSCGALKKVKYKGAPAFATPIPDSVLYIERREYFRIKPLISHPAYINLRLEDDQPVKLKITDIGVKGLSFTDTGSASRAAAGDRFENCRLILPANPSVLVTLEIRYRTGNGKPEDGNARDRVGAKFIDLNQGLEFTLQRFINMVQIEQNAMVKS